MKKKILIVESDKAIVHSFRNIFPSSEFILLPAVSGSRKTIETVKSKKPDIVIIRPVLNGAPSGFAAAERIINDHGIPVIFLIDKSDKKTVRGSKVKSASGLIVTPVDPCSARAVVDIALLKHHSERELRIQRHRLSTIMKSVGDAVIAADRKGRIEFMNTAAEKLTGWSEEKAAGKLLPAVIVAVKESTGRKFPNPAAKIIRARETVSLYSDAIVLSKDGSRYVVESSGSPIVDEKGEMTGVVVSFQDVTARRKVELENKKNEQRFRALVEKSSEAVSILDIDGTIRFTATATTAMLGYGQQEFIGRNAFDFAHPDELEKNTELFSRIVKSRGKGIRAELRFRHKNNSWRWLETISTNFVDDPAIDGIVVNFRDITARKEFEEQLNYTNKRLGLISRVTSEVIGSQPIPRQILSMIQQVRSAFNVDTVIVRRLEGEELFLLASTGVNEENIVDTISSRKGIANHIFTDKSAVAYTNVRELFPEYFNEESGNSPERSFDFVSYAGAPLLIGHTIIGIIGLFTVAKQRVFRSTDLEHLQIVANHIAVAIANNRLFREIRDQNIEMVKHIDEQNKVERLLRESEERYRTLVEFSPTAIVVHVNGVLRFANQAALSLVRASAPDELIGTSVMKYVHPSYQALAKKRITQVYSNKAVSAVEQTWIRLDGSTVDVETISIPFVYEGEHAAQVIARDITERKKAEEA
ncbi:MAG: PAS domain S-box protein, partial [Bacteroidota bacterium]